MFKYKRILIIVCSIILCIILDFLYIFILKRPLFVMQSECSSCNNKVYRGIFYDTYDCESHSIPQIKIKGSNFKCSLAKNEENNVIKIYRTEHNNDLIKYVMNNQNNNEYLINYYGISSALIIIDGKTYELVDAIKLNLITVEQIVESLHLIGIFKDGGSKMFTSVPNEYNSIIYNYNILLCNKIYGTKDIYIGSSDMKYENGFCDYNEN